MAFHDWMTLLGKAAERLELSHDDALQRAVQNLYDEAFGLRTARKSNRKASRSNKEWTPEEVERFKQSPRYICFQVWNEMITQTPDVRRIGGSRRAEYLAAAREAYGPEIDWTYVSRLFKQWCEQRSRNKTVTVDPMRNARLPPTEEEKVGCPVCAARVSRTGATPHLTSHFNEVVKIAKEAGWHPHLDGEDLRSAVEEMNKQGVKLTVDGLVGQVRRTHPDVVYR